MKRRLAAGFALPSVIISALVLLTVLTAVLGSATSVKTVLDSQFYQALARDAAESGVAHATSCLQSNDQVSTWGSNQLHPNTSCSGGAACTDATNCFIVKTDNYSTTYTVDPATDSGTGTQLVTVVGTVNLLRKTTGGVWRTYTQTTKVRTGGQVRTNKIIFGYVYRRGAFFATINGDGIMRGAGYNVDGQLGNGTFDETLALTTFNAPTTYPIVSGYSSFLSLGYNLFAIDSQGVAYGSGRNDYGQLGVGISGSTQASLSTPARVIIPNGSAVKSISVLGKTTYFLAADNNVYAAGYCGDGLLGSNYTVAGCASPATPVRVNLPAPNTADPNTIPTAEIITDRSTTYIRMAGGRVYGWGASDRAQLGTNTFEDVASPLKLGTFGDAGKPRAVQIAADGDTLYVLDDTGKISSIGMNAYGEMGNATSSITLEGDSRDLCFNVNSDAATLQLVTCNGTTAQKFEIRTDGTVYNALYNKCLDNKGVDLVTLWLYPCNGTAAQKFEWRPYARQLYNAQANKCVDNKGADGITLWLYACNNTSAQRFMPYNAEFTAFNASSLGSGVRKIWTDQWSLSALTTGGEIWSAGINTSGQLGNGATAEYTPMPVKFAMPIAAKDLYEANNDIPTNYMYQNLYAVGTDGSVYGAGANSFGQLGLGTITDREVTPKKMQMFGSTLPAAQVQAGLGTTVIFAANGSVYSVGNNSNGQLGDGTTVSKSTPIRAKYINDLNATIY